MMLINLTVDPGIRVLARKITSFRQSENIIVLRVRVRISGNTFLVKRVF